MQHKPNHKTNHKLIDNTLNTLLFITFILVWLTA